MRTRLVFPLATLALLSGGASSFPGPANQHMLGQPAPSFRLPDLSGNLVALEDLRGQLIVLHFAASW
jgi:hypothetical protein